MIVPETQRERLLTELFGVEGEAPSAGGRLLRSGEVATLFRVSTRAVTDWAAKGWLRSERTPGGHHRYRADDVRALLIKSGVVADE